MRLALTIVGGFEAIESSHGIAVDSQVANAARSGVGSEILIVPASENGGAFGTAQLLAIDAIEGSNLLRLSPGRWLGLADVFAGLFEGPFPLQLLTNADYEKVLAAADRAQFPPQPVSRADNANEAASLYFDEKFDGVSEAVVASLRRETGNVCALTGKALDAYAAPTVIRPGGRPSLHVNNLLLLSPAAEAAFHSGHFSVRDDLAVLVDFARIDPELLEQINPDGRLIVSPNAALRPSTENLAWHRTAVFGLS